MLKGCPIPPAAPRIATLAFEVVELLKVRAEALAMFWKLDANRVAIIVSLDVLSNLCM